MGRGLSDSGSDGEMSLSDGKAGMVGDGLGWECDEGWMCFCLSCAFRFCCLWSHSPRLCVLIEKMGKKRPVPPTPSL